MVLIPVYINDRVIGRVPRTYGAIEVYGKYGRIYSIKKIHRVAYPTRRFVVET